jgi:hypothetical protein
MDEVIVKNKIFCQFYLQKSKIPFAHPSNFLFFATPKKGKFPIQK